MGERRLTQREITSDHEVRCLTELADGTVLEGNVRDCSLGGARIVGPTGRLGVGDEVKLVFVFRTDERVAYQGTVKHLAPDNASFGVEFESDPVPIEPQDS